MLISCSESVNTRSAETSQFASFLDIPGITIDEINAIRSLQERGLSFVYGMTPSTEAFYDSDNIIKGFSALFCEWLTSLFDIQFTPAVFEWGDLIAGLESGEIDFSGDLTPTEKRRETYYMTTPIVQRVLKNYRIRGSQPLSEIQKFRPLNLIFLDGSVTPGQLISANAYPGFQSIFIRDYESAYKMLINGTGDAFLDDNSSEIVFDTYGDVVMEDFFPVIFNPISLTTRKTALQPVISVVQKALYHNSLRYLTWLYNRGYHEYLRYKFYMQLTAEEIEYIQAGHTVRFVAESYSYPVSFYNAQEKQWQGIAFDVMEEIEVLTGLSFEIANKPHTPWSVIIKSLEDGDVEMVTELIKFEYPSEHFIWPANSFMKSNYALLSKSEFPNIAFNEIMNTRVGLIRDTAYAESFRRWFPDHENAIFFESLDVAITAMDRGYVDMVMATQHQFLILVNFRELPGYKINILFNYDYDSTFGFNKNEVLLCSIIDKSLALIDTNGISGKWMRKTFDYRVKLLQAQMPVIIGTPIVALVLFFLFLMFQRKRYENKRLEKMVHERTIQLGNSQRKLEAALKTARAANNSKSIFLANMSHEIRTPMNSIMGFSELAYENETSARTKDYLEKIKMNAVWLLQIINDILDISKIESGKMELEKIPFDMHELFSSCRSLVMPKAVEKGIKLHFYAEPSVGKRPLGDPTRLRQVFVNLLSNAIKFTHTGMVKLFSEIVKMDENSITLHFEIKDSGIGMSKEQLDRIFEPFTQAETGTTRKYGGSGLGLAITKNIVEMMGGKLFAESTVGIGSKFSFDLTFDAIPVTEEERVEKGILLKKIDKPSFEGEVLVCEDNEMNQFVISEHLSRVGLKAIVAENGKTGVDLFKERMRSGKTQFKLVFMDIHMPIMDGFEAAAEIIKLDANVPIVAMTANVMKEDLEVYKASGMPDCLGKPFTSQELWRCLLRYFTPLGDNDIEV